MSVSVNGLSNGGETVEFDDLDLEKWNKSFSGTDVDLENLVVATSHEINTLRKERGKITSKCVRARIEIGISDGNYAPDILAGVKPHMLSGLVKYLATRPSCVVEDQRPVLSGSRKALAAQVQESEAVLRITERVAADSTAKNPLNIAPQPIDPDDQLTDERFKIFCETFMDARNSTRHLTKDDMIKKRIRADLNRKAESAPEFAWMKRIPDGLIQSSIYKSRHREGLSPYNKHRIRFQLLPLAGATPSTASHAL